MCLPYVVDVQPYGPGLMVLRGVGTRAHPRYAMC